MPISPKIKPTYNLQFPIRVPDDVLVELGEFTGNFWSDSLAQEPFVIEAIRNYINPPPPPSQQSAATTEAGYQWKQVFLPEGTRLRATFGNQPYFATVVGAEIQYDGHMVSPSCFANLHDTRSKANALRRRSSRRHASPRRAISRPAKHDRDQPQAKAVHLRRKIVVASCKRV